MTIAKLLAGLLLTVGLTNAHAIPITISGPAAFNVDTAAPTIVTLNTALHGTISDLNLFLDFDASCCAYDNTVLLTHVNTGKTATIWVDSASIGAQSFGDVRNTIFDDAATVAFINAPYDTSGFDILPGTYSPSSLLSVFNGDDVFGTWELSIQNTGCCVGEGDNLLAWSLIVDIDTNTVPEPTTLALLALSLVGLGVVRRHKG